jgi:hypothetical protein
MPMLNIHHRTTYIFREKVSLSPHRLMLRLREGRELRLLSHEISIFPEAELSWSNDVFGNRLSDIPDTKREFGSGQHGGRGFDRG